MFLGSKINLHDKNYDTALHFAARQSNDAITSLIIQTDGDVNAKNQCGHTPLMEAVCYNNKVAKT